MAGSIGLTEPTFLTFIQAAHDKVLDMGGRCVGREVHEHRLIHVALELVAQEVLQGEERLLLKENPEFYDRCNIIK